ncbi:unnamed protein product [Rhizophagus irregularis]|nr:unnamed protein product [Rhizophagus irregularis]
MIRQICNTYFGTRRNVFKSSPEKSKAIKINNRRNNRTLKKFNARNMRDIIDAKVKVEQQRQAKLHKGSVSGITTPNQHIPKSYNLNTGIYNAVDSDSEYETINQDIAKSTQMNVDSVTEGFESDLTRSLNNFNNKVTNSEQYSLLDNNNQIMTVSEEALLASSTRLDIELNNTCDQSLSKQVDRNANDQRDQELVKPPKPAPKTTKKRKSNLKPVFRNTCSRAAK